MWRLMVIRVEYKFLLYSTRDMVNDLGRPLEESDPTHVMRADFCHTSMSIQVVTVELCIIMWSLSLIVRSSRAMATHVLPS